MNLEKLINWEETRKKIKADGRTPTSWARIRGFHVSTVNALILGRYPTTGELYGRMVEQLREDGYLVEEPENKAA